ncbi:MAG: PilZ domain-containing protein [Deltaproteobacteria bacterium]|nr:PilZ domain-containing protein [Deltaproteobacteria bacterium]
MLLGHEMRASPRVPVTQLVVGLVDGDRYVRGNISSGGVGFEIDELIPLRRGDPITVRLNIPDSTEPLAMSAVVQHSHYRDHDGVFYVGALFVDVDELVQNPLDRFVEETSLLERTPAYGVPVPAA